MTVAEHLVGAWRRAGLVVDGARVADRCNVLWLQSTEMFADIRIPAGASPVAGGTAAVEGPAGLFARPTAFAGAAHFDEPSMVWDHLLDANPHAGTDVGTLDLSRAGWAYEDGTVTWDGRKVPFREEWERLSPPGASVEIEAELWATPRRISATVGRWRIDIADSRPEGGFRAERLEYTGSVWEVVGSVVAPCTKP